MHRYRRILKHCNKWILLDNIIEYYFQPEKFNNADLRNLSPKWVTFLSDGHIP
jgi:hypothetical protein